MKKILLAILIAVGLVGCGSSSVDPRHVMLGNMGCSVLGLQLEKVNASKPYYGLDNWNDVRIVAQCSQRVSIIVEYTPEEEQETTPAPTKQSKPVLKDV